MNISFQAINWSNVNAYLAKSCYIDELCYELRNIYLRMNNLIIADKQLPPVFAMDIWYEPKLMTIGSINDAANQLKAIQRYWHPYAEQYARRTLLIAEKLIQYKKLTALTFPLPTMPVIGEFTLLDEQHVLYATQRAKVVPDGCFNFVEDKVNPPNRAYLKLWEALAVLGRYPQAGEFAVDLGASPGGWTYVLQSLGANVLAIDKAPLDPAIAQLPGVDFHQASAFSLRPEDFTTIDWLVCDVACYPERLYQWLLPWLKSGKVKQFIVTIKLQGKTDFAAIERFQQIPRAQVLHLQHNKHEVTFFYGN